jgi:hypothetical protein
MNTRRRKPSATALLREAARRQQLDELMGAGDEPPRFTFMLLFRSGERGNRVTFDAAGWEAARQRGMTAFSDEPNAVGIVIKEVPTQ